MHLQQNDFKLPRVAETPVDRTFNNSPLRIISNDTKPQLDISRRRLFRQKKIQSLLDEHLSSKFFLHDSPIGMKTVNFSPDFMKNKGKFHRACNREIERVKEKLIIDELSLKKISNFEPTHKKLELEYKIYIDHLEHIANCFALKYPDLYKNLNHAISNVSQVFSKFTSILSIELNPPVVESEKIQVKLSKHCYDNYSQTDQSSLDPGEIMEIQNIRELSQKIQSINMKKVTRKLAEVQNSLASMYSHVPKTPETPNISKENLIALLCKLHKKQGIIVETAENWSQTTEIKFEPMILQFNSDKQLEEDLYNLKKQYEEEKANIKYKISEITSPRPENDSNSHAQTLEIEIMSLRSKYKTLEEKYFQLEKSSKESAFKGLPRKTNTDKKNNSKKAAETLKEGLIAEIAEQKLLLDLSNSKLSQIEEAWLKRTGNRFVYNNPAVDLLSINTLEPTRPTIVSPKPLLDSKKSQDTSKNTNSSSKSKNFFDTPSERKPRASQVKVTSETLSIPAGSHSLGASRTPRQAPDLSPPVVSAVKAEGNEITEKFIAKNTVDTTGEEKKHKKKYSTMERSADRNIEESERNFIYKETEETYKTYNSAEFEGFCLDQGEEKLYRALTTDQWKIFLEYKFMVKEVKLKEVQINLLNNSKSCYMNALEQKLIKAKKHSKSVESVKNQNSTQQIIVQNELSNMMENPKVKVLFNSTLQTEDLSSIPISAKIKLMAIFKDHLIKQCRESCEHLKRAMRIGYKYRGKRYPINTIKII